MKHIYETVQEKYTIIFKKQEIKINKTTMI